MSNETFNAIWQEAVDLLQEQVMAEDHKVAEHALKPTLLIPGAPAAAASSSVSIEAAFQHFARVYIEYLGIFKKLNQCYDSLVHPQKREDVLVVLELVMQRVIQLKHLLVKWNIPRSDLVIPGQDAPFPWEYVNLDDVLVDMKLPPETLEIPIPRYFKENNADGIKLRDRLITEFMKLNHPEGEESVPLEVDEDQDLPPDDLTMDHLLEIIQRNERGRQGKVRAFTLRGEAEANRRILAAATKEWAPEDVAATGYQRVYRGYKARRFAAADREAELVFLGIKPRSGTTWAEDQLRRDLAAAQHKRKTEQAENKASYARDQIDLKQVVMRDEGPAMRDRLRQERHLWVTDKIAETKDIPEDLTGFYRDKYPALPEPEPMEEVGGGKKGKKDDKKGGKKEEKGGKKGKKKKEAEDLPPELPPALEGEAPVLSDMYKRIVSYRGGWEAKDESGNFAQRHDRELAKTLIRVDVERELRDTVDDMLKQNLAKIKAQLAGGGKAVKKKKGKGGKNPRGGKGGKKKKGKGKGKPLPGEKIGDVKSLDMDGVLNVLTQARLVNSYRSKRVVDFVGGFNYVGAQSGSVVGAAALAPDGPTAKALAESQKAKAAAAAEAGIKLPRDKTPPPPPPSMAQIRGAITEYCILPLGSVSIKAKLESTNIKTIMFYGPAGSGKTMMVEAIASELGALLINISPSRLAEMSDGPLRTFFSGKQGPTKLAHLIYKLAAENPEVVPGGNPQAPVIVYMDECEKFFEAGGKKQKVDKNGPTRFKKDFLSYKNLGYKPIDRVLFIGSTRSPEKADKKDLKAFFDKFLFFPFPDYQTRLLLWKTFTKELFEKNGAPELPHSFDFSTLARITDGFSAGTIKRCIRKTLTPKRLGRLSERRLEGNEFINFLALEASRNQQAQHDLAVLNDFTAVITGLADRQQKIEDILHPAEGGEDKKKKGAKKK